MDDPILKGGTFTEFIKELFLGDEFGAGAVGRGTHKEVCASSPWVVIIGGDKVGESKERVKMRGGDCRFRRKGEAGKMGNGELVREDPKVEFFQKP